MSEKRTFRNAIVLACGDWTVHFVATAAVCLAMMVAVPRFADLFVQNDIELPSATRLAISLSIYFVKFYYTLAIPLAVDAALLIGLNMAPPKFSWLARVWSALAMLFAVLFLAFCMLAISVAVERGPERLE